MAGILKTCGRTVLQVRRADIIILSLIRIEYFRNFHKKMNPFHKSSFWIVAAVLLFAAFLALTFAGIYKSGGLCFAGFWFALAMLVRFNDFSRSFSYTLIVVACVTSSMYFPEFYLTVNGVQTMVFITPILQVIMFGMGTQLTLRDFQGVIKQPYGVIVGMILQFTVMPGVALLLALTFQYPPEIAAGVILIGCVPVGIASNVMNFIAKGNMALAISITLVSTMTAPIATPFLMKYLAGQFVEIELLKMTVGITNLVILPIMGGLMFRTLASRTIGFRSVAAHLLSFVCTIAVLNGVFAFAGHTFESLGGQILSQIGIFLGLPILGASLLRTLVVHHPDLFNKLLSIFSMIGLLLTIVIINAAGRDHLLQIGLLLIFSSLLHNLAGFLFGYWGAKLFRLDERSCRTISIEVGLQNGGLASGIALQMGKAATVGLAPAVFGPLMNITGSSLATWWRSRPVPETVDTENAETENTPKAAHDKKI